MKNSTFLNTLRRQAGVTILEFIAFIGLAALVIAGALSLYSSGSRSASVQEIRSTAASMASQVKSLASANGGYSGITTTSLLTPNGWRVNGSAIQRVTNTSQSFQLIGATSSAINLQFTADSIEVAEAIAGFRLGSSSGSRNNLVITWRIDDSL